MPSKPIFTAAELDAASYAALTAQPTSELAASLCRDLCTKLLHQQKRRPREKQIDAFGAIVADLLERDPDDKGGWLFRSLSPNHYTGEAIGFRPFIFVFDLMPGLMIEMAMGTRQYVTSEFTGGVRQPAWDRATRFRATEWLRNWFEEQGITRANWSEHFVRTYAPSSRKQCPLERRGTKPAYGAGRRVAPSMTIDPKDPVTASLISRMDRINDYLGAQEVKPYGHIFLRRIFSNGDQPGFAWDCGGRMNALGAESFQTAKKAERARITINGEATVEIDLRASHLTILVGLGHLPKSILEPDPYSIDGLPRAVVKQWVTMTISHGKRHKRWPTKAKDELLEKHEIDLTRDFPLKALGDAILAKLPILDAEGQSTLAGWGELQFQESEILLSAMETLAYEHDVPALPVHDSLIVPALKGSLAISVLKEAFRASVGIEPSVN